MRNLYNKKNMTLTGFVFGVLLLALPLYVGIVMRTGLTRRFLIAVVKFVVYLVLLALCLWTLQTHLHWAFGFLAVLVMAVGGAGLTVHWARVGQRNYFVPMVVAFVTTLFVVLVWMWLLVVGLHHGFFVQYMVPLAGLLTGAMIEADSAALSAYYTGLLHHGQLYEYLLGNGATHQEATAFFVRRAMQKAMIPLLHRMALTLLFYAPVLFWALLLSGCPVWTALGWQVVLSAAMLFSAVAALLVMVVVARRYSFDAYERLKPSKPQTVGHDEDAEADKGSDKLVEEEVGVEIQVVDKQANEHDETTEANWLSMEV